ncbi:hypothetical protein RQP46_003615 [Phenoliferia psychrophenolica]
MSCCGSHAEPCSSSELFHASSVVPKDQVAEVRRVHELLQGWLKASSDDAGQEGARAALLKLKVSPEHQSTNLKPLQAIITSITALYWSTTNLALSPEQRSQLADRLTDIPAFEDRVPQFSGKEVEAGAELTDKKLEAIMRVGAYILPSIADQATIEMWRELSEVSANAWEL